MTKRWTPTVAVLVAAALLGCGGGDSPAPAPGGVPLPTPTTAPLPVISTVSVSAPTTDLVVGETFQVKASAIDPAGLTISGLLQGQRWTSQNPGILAVSQTGNVTAMAPGTSTVVATFDSAAGPVSGSLTLSSHAQMTMVSGVIRADASWVASQSPYRLKSRVQVDYGVTLRLEPGVKVTAIDYEQAVLLIGGTLHAYGTQEKPITLDRVNIVPAGSSAQNHLIDLRYVRMTGGSLYSFIFGVSQFGTLQLRDSRLQDLDQFLYISNPTATVNIERNVFLMKGGLSIGFDARNTPIEVIVRNNYFANAGAVSSWAAYGSASGVRVERNTFAAVGQRAVSLERAAAAMITATENWWGTTDPSVIATMIFDRNDDIQIPGAIPFLPVLTAPDPATPVP